MPKNDLFKHPFDEGTLDKLAIFEDYLKEWLPVFVANQNPIWKEIQIMDLFAGVGKDKNGTPGSPLRILSVLNANKELIRKSGVKIKVTLNEFEREKFKLLLENVQANEDKSLYEVEVLNDDFLAVFNERYESLKKTANFLFLDQNGIKQITEEIFKKIVVLRQTDMLFFISSSFIKRFAEVEEFKHYFKITKEELEGKSYYHIHRMILSYYRNLIEVGRIYFLAPFSIKKPSGIYGLIFGSNHTYGIEKFLGVCWKHDKLTGEANYDIDKENINLRKPSLFAEYNIPSKRQVFEEGTKERILTGKLKTGRQIYLYTLQEGFLLKDVNKILKQLKDQNKISFEFNLITSKLHKLSIPNDVKLL